MRKNEAALGAYAGIRGNEITAVAVLVSELGYMENGGNAAPRAIMRGRGVALAARQVLSRGVCFDV